MESKIYKVFIDGEFVEGNAFSIIKLLKNKSFLNSELSIDDFIKEIQYNIWKLFAIGIDINNNLNTYDKCESLVKKLIKHKLLPSK